MIEILLNIIAPVVITAGIGFFWAKSGRAFHTETVTGLVTNVGSPMLIFSTLVKLDMELGAFLEFAMYAALSALSFCLIGLAVLRICRLDIRNYLPGLMFPNTGNMGLPLCFFAFGEAGLALAIAVFTVFSTLQFTFGVWLSSGASSPGQLMRTPLIYAVIIGLGSKALSLSLPVWIIDTSVLVGSLTIPLMLLALGVSLAGLSVNHIRLATGLSLLRLVMGFAVGYGLSILFGLEGVERGVLILECCMPVAVFNYLFSLRYDRAHGHVAGMVLISTLLSFITLPALLLYVL
ncbi:AEC family transporter [Sneathiella litorea]|uniref:AEC family transporter n=1 Tax=Sneathiella litorea TaxID=2606216 RepID=A0A6L8W2W4_9PROT|nr:AEC family transporter [Sneathiella litorea]MZR29281.1 AEC family transporter [Sneathiella litorea]